MHQNKQFYTYIWMRYDGTPYYVGKGYASGKFKGRAFRKTCPPKERIIIQYHDSEEDALWAEIFLISFYGRIDIGTGCLRNNSRGGEGYAEWSDEARDKMRKLFKKKNIFDPIKHSKIMMGSGNPMYGKKRTINKEWREKLRSSKLGHTVSKETKEKMSTARMGRKFKTKPTHCYRGHEFTIENTWIGKTGSRFCLQCRKINHDTYNQKKAIERIKK